jgi:hypothetical protein
MANAMTGETDSPDASPVSGKEEGEELIEQDIRDRLKKMCEGYFDSVSKKLGIEHKVSHRYSVFFFSFLFFPRVESV